MYYLQRDIQWRGKRGWTIYTEKERYIKHNHVFTFVFQHLQIFLEEHKQEEEVLLVWFDILIMLIYATQEQ